jgi:hypothetical protein
MRRRLTALVLMATASLGANGCSGSPASSAGGGSATSTSAATSSPLSSDTTTRAPTSPTAGSPHRSASSSAVAPTESTSPAATSSSGPVQNSAPQRATTAQIPAAQLPGFTAGWTWDRTSPSRGLASPCLRSGLVSIGAVTEVGRTFHDSSAPASSTAAQVTAVFPDEHTALTAAAVLTAWHDDCAKNAAAHGLQDVVVRPLSAVPTPVGTGQQWLVTAQPSTGGQRSSQLFVWQGFVRDADTITLLVYARVAPHYTYATGTQPIDRGLAVAGDYLLRSR